MKAGLKAALLITSAALVGCATAPAEVKLRALPDPAARLASNGDALAAARGALLLGNAGTALEAFRKLQRDRPNDPAPLAGIGDCYMAMGRFDVAQTSYESALAFAPHDRRLLLTLASIYDQEGQSAKALAARADADAAVAVAVAVVPAPVRVAAAAVPAPTPAKVAAVAPSMVRTPPKVAAPLPPPLPHFAAASSTITVELPPARPVARVRVDSRLIGAMAQVAEIAPAPTVPSVPVVQVSHEPTPAVVSTSAPVTHVALAARPPAPAALPPMAAVGSITVELPAAKPATQLADRTSTLTEASRAGEFVLPAAQVAAVLRPPLPAVEVAAIPRRAIVPEKMAAIAPHLQAIAPPPPVPVPVAPEVPRETLAPLALPPVRLERLSSSEVALVTSGKPIWRAQSPVQTASNDPVHWAPLPKGSASPNVQVLNAARSQGIAASARTVLLERGWRGIAVGDAPAMESTTVVYYPLNRAAVARSLAAQFGVNARLVAGDRLILVLGRDAIGVVSPQRRS